MHMVVVVWHSIMHTCTHVAVFMAHVADFENKHK